VASATVVAAGFSELVLLAGGTGFDTAVTPLTGRSTAAVIVCPGTVALALTLGVLVAFGPGVTAAAAVVPELLTLCEPRAIDTAVALTDGVTAGLVSAIADFAVEAAGTETGVGCTGTTTVAG